jgi:hypothetical protein
MSFHFKISLLKLCYHFTFPHMCYISRSSHPPPVNDSYNIQGRIEIKSSLICNCHRPPKTLLSHRFTYSSQNFVCNYAKYQIPFSRPRYFLDCWDSVNVYPRGVTESNFHTTQHWLLPGDPTHSTHFSLYADIFYRYTLSNRKFTNSSRFEFVRLFGSVLSSEAHQKVGDLFLLIIILLLLDLSIHPLVLPPRQAEEPLSWPTF